MDNCTYLLSLLLQNQSGRCQCSMVHAAITTIETSCTCCSDHISKSTGKLFLECMLSFFLPSLLSLPSFPLSSTFLLSSFSQFFPTFTGVGSRSHLRVYRLWTWDITLVFHRLLRWSCQKDSTPIPPGQYKKNSNFIEPQWNYLWADQSQGTADSLIELKFSLHDSR